MTITRLFGGGKKWVAMTQEGAARDRTRVRHPAVLLRQCLLPPLPHGSGRQMIMRGTHSTRLRQPRSRLRMAWEGLPFSLAECSTTSTSMRSHRPA